MIVSCNDGIEKIIELWDVNGWSKANLLIKTSRDVYIEVKLCIVLPNVVESSLLRYTRKFTSKPESIQITLIAIIRMKCWSTWHNIHLHLHRSSSWWHLIWWWIWWHSIVNSSCAKLLLSIVIQFCIYICVIGTALKIIEIRSRCLWII